eukprot:6411975-Prymnesium_polylepis.1
MRATRGAGGLSCPVGDACAARVCRTRVPHAWETRPHGGAPLRPHALPRMRLELPRGALTAHDLQRLEHVVLVAGEGCDARADRGDGGVERAEAERRSGRRAPVGRDRAHGRAPKEGLREPEDLRRLVGRDEIVQQPHARRREYLPARVQAARVQAARVQAAR